MQKFSWRPSTSDPNVQVVSLIVFALALLSLALVHCGYGCFGGPLSVVPQLRERDLRLVWVWVSGGD